ncbi:hypothetical protein CBR_g27903 [Chara braunii]|uniref:Uncharacterized protein n=1 Tax=Chara braunii TaxID=69332 RepID=A0A388L8N6_CHABU|nr:hypothetical protein CBR_g27903 [Chara braunii]|eukprot:GBG78680.1 hypothetical protein CBR_g27903 [Chara braunii]
MDGAEARDLCSVVTAIMTPRRVGGRGASCEAWSVSLGEAGPGADLGGSSKYSNENFEDRSGEGFHVNSAWTWVSRPGEILGFMDDELLRKHLPRTFSLIKNESWGIEDDQIPS